MQQENSLSKKFDKKRLYQFHHALSFVGINILRTRIHSIYVHYILSAYKIKFYCRKLQKMHRENGWISSRESEKKRRFSVNILSFLQSFNILSQQSNLLEAFHFVTCSQFWRCVSIFIWRSLYRSMLSAHFALSHSIKFTYLLKDIVAHFCYSIFFALHVFFDVIILSDSINLLYFHCFEKIPFFVHFFPWFALTANAHRHAFAWSATRSYFIRSEQVEIQCVLP